MLLSTLQCLSQGNIDLYTFIITQTPFQKYYNLALILAQKKRVNNIGVDLGLNIGDNQNVVLNEDSLGVGNHGNKVIYIYIYLSHFLLFLYVMNCIYMCRCWQFIEKDHAAFGKVGMEE